MIQRFATRHLVSSPNTVRLAFDVCSTISNFFQCWLCISALILRQFAWDIADELFLSTTRTKIHKKIGISWWIDGNMRECVRRKERNSPVFAVVWLRPDRPN